MQESQANDQYRHAEQQMFIKTVEGLKHAYDENREEHMRQVRAYRAAGERINSNLRHEMAQLSYRFENADAESRREIGALRTAAEYWCAGAEEEASLQAQFTSELSHERAAQHLLCQNLRAEVSLIPHVELQSKKEIDKLQVAVSYWKMEQNRR